MNTTSDMIVRFVRVDRNRTPQQMLDATGRIQHVNKSVLESVPRGEGEEIEVFFFRANGCDLEKEYEHRGLKPDVYAQCAVNEEDPAFANTYPNGAEWKGADGKYPRIIFYSTLEQKADCSWHPEGRVVVEDDYYVWPEKQWFAGVKK